MNNVAKTNFLNVKTQRSDRIENNIFKSIHKMLSEKEWRLPYPNWEMHD